MDDEHGAVGPVADVDRLRRRRRRTPPLRLTAAPADWLEVPMLFPNAWRLTLLFLVSGYASRFLLAKSGGRSGTYSAKPVTPER